MFYRAISALAAIGMISACSPEPTPAEAFFEQAHALCGNAFAGKLVSTDEVDADFAAANIVMHVRDCSESEIRIPLHVDDNRSRTWIITWHGDDLRLKHDHRHEDGESDEVTMYGGDSTKSDSFTRFEFPADDFSKAMFEDAGIGVSSQNTWAIEVDENADLFAYEMSRPNRFFRIEFDTSAPVETPPAAWGSQ